MLRATRKVGEAGQSGQTRSTQVPHLSRVRMSRTASRPTPERHIPIRCINVVCGCGFVAIAVIAAAAWPATARADAVAPSPRAAVEIGGASVVLVAARDKIYALVDRLDDNAPVAEFALSVDLADGSSLKLSRVSDGLFVAPFTRAGRVQDSFMISLVSPFGSGNGAAEIVYDAAPVREAPTGHFDLRSSAIALVGGPVGALMGGPFLRSLAARHTAIAHPPASGDNLSARLPDGQKIADQARSAR